MAVFNGVDFLRFDDLLTEEEKTIRQAVRDWVEEKFLPLIEHHYEAATFPSEIIPQIAELGLLGANLPDEYGCAGLGNVAYGLAMQELERGDSGLRSFASVQGALVMYPIFAYGSEEQSAYWLPKLASGEKIGCFGLTEPDSGSDPGGMITTAKTVPTAASSTAPRCGSPTARWPTSPIVWAAPRRREDPRLHRREGHEGLHGARAEAQVLAARLGHERAHPAGRARGARRDPAQRRGPQGAAGLPHAGALRHRLGRAGRGDGLLPRGARVLEGARHVRQADRRVPAGAGEARRHAHRDHQGPAAVRCSSAGSRSRKLYTPEQVSMAKRNNCEIALDIAREARDILGANGITGEYPVMRHMCNLESVKTYEGTHNIHTLVLGEAVTGIPAYR